MKVMNVTKNSVLSMLNNKALFLFVDIISILVYLLVGTMFYTTKNICDAYNPLECYGFFCVIFIAIFTVNGLFNINIIIKSASIIKVWCYKMAFLIIPIILFLIITIG